MNIKGQGHSLTLVQGHSDSTFSNVFFLETAGPVEAKFHVVPPWNGGMKDCSNVHGHITSMAAMSIYGKNLKICFSGTKGLMTLKVGMQHWILEFYQVFFFSNDEPGLTLTYYTTMSNLIHYAFVWEKGKTFHFFRIHCSL